MTRPAPDVVRLREDQIEIAGAMLARAFLRDPLAVYMLPDGSERARLLQGHFSPFVKYGCLVGEVHTTMLLEGVAVWLPPGCGDTTPERAAQAGLDKAPAAIGEAPWRRFAAAMDYLAAAHTRAVPVPHWYLPLLGVETTRQGHGVGTALLQTVLVRADAAGHPCYLETFEPTNVPFYERHGFETVSNGHEPTSGLSYWAMRRAPPAAGLGSREHESRRTR